MLLNMDRMADQVLSHVREGGTNTTTTTTMTTTATTVTATEETDATAIFKRSTICAKVGGDERGDVVRFREGVMFSDDADG